MRTPGNPSTPTQPAGTSALAFVDSYMQLVESSVHSATALDNRRASFAASCILCEDGAATAEQILAGGYTVNGGEIEHSAEVAEQSEQSALVQVRYRIGEIKLTDGAGTVVSSAQASSWATQVLDVRKQGDGTWLIVSAEQLP